jgi:hypothetical protein
VALTDRPDGSNGQRPLSPAPRPYNWRATVGLIVGIVVVAGAMGVFMGVIRNSIHPARAHLRAVGATTGPPSTASGRSPPTGGPGATTSPSPTDESADMPSGVAELTARAIIDR